MSIFYQSIKIILLIITINKIYGEISVTYNLFSGKPEVTLYLNPFNKTSLVTFTLNQIKPYNLINSTISSAITYGKKSKVFIQNNQYDVTEYSTNLQLSLTKISIINKFNFYLISQKEKEIIRNILSLSYYIENEAHSIVHQLYENNIINKKQYSLRPLTYFQGLLYFGELSSDTMLNRLIGSCKIKTSKTTWGCTLKKVLLFNRFRDNEKIIYYGEKYVSFQYNKKKSTVSCDFMDFLREKYFYHLIHLGTCSLEQIKTKMFFACNKNTVLSSFPLLELVFNGVTVHIELSNLFICHVNGNCTSYFKCYTDKEQYEWALGSNFLENYITTFDYDNEVVQFAHTLTPNIVEPNNEIETLTIYKKRFILIIICIIILMLFILLWLRKNINI